MQLACPSLLAAALMAAWPASALQIRPDRDDAEYLELATRYGACIPIASEGEGVLVASRWVLTSARVASGLRAMKEKAFPPVRFGGVEHEIQAIFNEGDIGLIQLRKPVTGVTPIFLYRSSDEAGKTVVLVAHGRGGRIGEKEAAPDRKARGAINTVDRVATRSIALEVKGPDDASDLQGALASDEDGACAIVETRDGLFVAGIAIGRERASVGLVSTGDRDTYARVSAYAGWIGSVMLGIASKEVAELLGDGDRR